MFQRKTIGKRRSPSRRHRKGLTGGTLVLFCLLVSCDQTATVGEREDAAIPSDASGLDTRAPTDVGVADARTVDVSAPDTGTSDAGSPDAGRRDGGIELVQCNNGCDGMVFFDCITAAEHTACRELCNTASADSVSAFVGCSPSSCDDDACWVEFQARSS